MTLTLELSQETEIWLQTEAAKQGIAPDEYARRLIEDSRIQPQWQAFSTEERRARLKGVRGKYKHTGFTTEDLHQERQCELAHEERRFLQHFGEQKQ